MILNAYSILDTQTGIWSQPWFLVHDAVAYRSVMDIASDANTTLARHPNDYVLYGIGDFDDSIGTMRPSEPRNLGVVSAILASSTTNGRE